MSRQACRRLDASWRRRNVAGVLLLSILAAGALAAAAPGRIWFDRRPPVDDVRVSAGDEKINPNTASAASLNRLPRIGPSRAKAIADYAAAHGQKAFGFAEDLHAVKGIGPITVRQIATYLSLPSQQADTQPNEGD